MECVSAILLSSNKYAEASVFSVTRVTSVVAKQTGESLRHVLRDHEPKGQSDEHQTRNYFDSAASPSFIRRV